MTSVIINQVVVKPLVRNCQCFKQLCFVANTIEKKVKPNLQIHSNETISKRFSQISPLTCWKCGIERNSESKIFCEKCNYIQNPIETQNFFKVMDVDETFDVDNKLLGIKYRNLQTLLHPDKFSTKSLEEKQISEEFSSLVNKAYNNLQTPLKRAEHLLQLKGISIDENQTVDDPEFLMNIMMLNEEVENAKDDNALKELDRKNKLELNSIAKDIDNYFKNNDLVNAKKSIVKMKYYSSLSNRINTLMRELGIVD